MTQIPMFQPTALWRPPSLSELPDWSAAKRVGIDIETKDPQLKKLGPGVRRGAEIIGISFAIEDGPSHYLPIGHSEDNLPSENVFRYLKHQAEHFGGILVGANMQYDLDFLAEKGIWFGKTKQWRDVQVAEPLIDELQTSYSLDSILERHGLPIKDEALMREAATAWQVDAKKEMWKLPARFVGSYATWDADAPLKALRRQERIIDEQGIWGIFDLESAVLPVCLKMRRRGVRVSWQRLEQVETWAINEARVACQRVYDETGIRLNWRDVWKPDAIAAPLLHTGVALERGKGKRLKSGEWKEGKYSVDKDLLAALDRGGNPIAKHLARARRMNKVSTTFAESIRKHAIGDRIHGSFNQLRMNKDDSSDDDKGARYGRLSSTDPNLQQQPARDPEIGNRWRSIYIPDEGGIWAANDYSQQEPRMLVHFAELCGLPRAAEMATRYRTDPTADNHDMMTCLIHGEDILDRVGADRFKELRGDAKIIFLGKCYGMGGGKLCRNLGLPTEWIYSQKQGRMIEVAGPEGQAIIDQFDSQLPFVKQLAYRCSNFAEKEGYLKTILGRKCRFPVDAEGKYDWTHKALNRLIQGSSADQTKAAMVQIDAAGFDIQLQVHDEIDLTVYSPKEAEDVAEIMRTCVNINVPSKVDVEIGPNWGNAIEFSKWQKKAAEGDKAAIEFVESIA